MKLTKYKQWMETAGRDAKNTAARIADTSPAMLYQVATGFRKASADLASRIEEGIATANRKDDALPDVKRGDISETCAKCPFYKECRK